MGELLKTNCIKVKVSPTTLRNIQVSIKNDEDGTLVSSELTRKKVINRMFQQVMFKKCVFVYDGYENVYIVGSFNGRDGSVIVGLDESSQKLFKVEFKKKRKKIHVLESDGKVNPNVLGIIDCSVRQTAEVRGSLLIDQFYYIDDKKNCFDITGGVTGVRGFYSSFHTTESGLTLNIDMSTIVTFTPSCVIQCITAIQNVKDHDKIDWAQAALMLKNMRIKKAGDSTEFMITGFSEKTCGDQEFDDCLKVGGRKTGLSVFDYYTKHLKIELTTPDNRCVDVGTPEKPLYIPLELCSFVPLQLYPCPLSPTQKTCLDDQSSQEVNFMLDFYAANFLDKNKFFNACGMSIADSWITVKGRILDTPALRFGQVDDAYDENKVVVPAEVSKWAIVNFSSNGDCKDIVNKLIDCAEQKGIHMRVPHFYFTEKESSKCLLPVERVDVMLSQIRQELEFSDMFESDRINLPYSFLLCILDEDNSGLLYGPWKYRCLTTWGVSTQRIFPTHKYDLYLNHMLMKINLKLGGINFSIADVPPSISETPTLILGMHLSHGSVGPSIAVVVGSRYRSCLSRYMASVRSQPGEEMTMESSLFEARISGNDTGIIREHFVDFYWKNDQIRPQQIILFRDGVSESQYNQVLDLELAAIKEAIRPMYEELPKFTIIFSQVNKHIKLFKADGSHKNVPAGTVVDTGIVHPKDSNFYMCTNHGTNGTSHPTHYHVLLNEIGMSADELQNLVHSLSYMYQLNSKPASDSIVAPIRYAHRTASQMRQIFDDDVPRLHVNVQRSMFFC